MPHRRSLACIFSYANAGRLAHEEEETKLMHGCISLFGFFSCAVSITRMLISTLELDEYTMQESRSLLHNRKLLRVGGKRERDGRLFASIFLSRFFLRGALFRQKPEREREREKSTVNND